MEPRDFLFAMPFGWSMSMVSPTGPWRMEMPAAEA